MTDTQTITCPACGGPNEPEAGRTHMPCAYCGAALTIPESLRVKIISSQKVNAQEIKFPQSEIDPSDLLRKAQPFALRAFNLYALWTWARWLFPACLAIFVASIALCLMLGALPLVLHLFR
jgi:hypothetical protein